MREPEEAKLELDPRFPSGAWTGFFLQMWLPGRHTTNMSLTFSEGQLKGTGRDWVGPYTIDGHYNCETGKCEWTKKYLGKHSVQYRGVNDGHGGIWGVWEIRLRGGIYTDRGGFHIWPEGTDVSAATDQTEEAVLAVMRQEYGSGPSISPLGILLLLVLVFGSAAIVWWLSGSY